MLFCQLGRADSLREICNGLGCCLGRLVHVGIARAPCRSTLSYANEHRPAALFEELFFTALARFCEQQGLGPANTIPYGAYDIARNRAVVNVGVKHETAEFAVESIRRWWRLDGKRHYQGAGRLLICADSGGSNGNRQRAWKLHLQELSDETGMVITICHYPPGTSKWNKISTGCFPSSV